MRLLSDEGQVVRERSAPAAGAVDLCPGSEISDGSYAIDCTWYGADGAEVTSVGYEVRKVSPVTAPAGYEALPARKRLVRG